jgi:hypothetical protein
MLRQLTLRDGQTIYVNPDHVVAVHPDFGAEITGCCVVQVRNQPTGWLVRGDVVEVVQCIETEPMKVNR